MKKIFFIATLLLQLPLISFSSEKLTIQMIWSNGKHCVFTTLINHKGYFYCAFREGGTHVDCDGGDNGKIRIIRSKTGLYWKSYDLISMKEKDLRDPSLTLNGEGTLVLTFVAAAYKEGRAVSYHTFRSTKRRRSFSTPRMLITDKLNDWLWRIHWFNGKAYGFNYISGFDWMESEDGVHFKTVYSYQFESRPTEADFCFVGSEIIAVVRRDNGTCLVGRGTNIASLNWMDTGMRLSAPKLLVLEDGRILIMAKEIKAAETKNLHVFQLQENHLFSMAAVEGKGDCGYQGAVAENGVLYMSYYQQGNVGTDIYLVRLLV